MGSVVKSKWLPICVLVWVALNSACSAPQVDNFDRASTVNRIMNSWVGHYESELVASWGPPTEVLPNEQGGNILVYESLKGTWGDDKDKQITGGAQYETLPRQSGYAATRTFYVNENGIITSWKWSGL